MIIALTAPILDLNSRSRSVSHVIDAIARAAERAPAPDLVVLPDCNMAGLSGPTRSPTAAMCTAFVETIARAAKEWGVWIAFGHPVMIDGEIVSAASVLDPDGDACLRFPPLASAEGDGHLRPIDVWAVRNTALGRWALRTGRSLGTPSALADDADVGFCIVPGGGDGPHPSHADFCAAAKSAGCAVCYTISQSQDTALESPASPLGAVIDADGKVTATLEAAQHVAVAKLDVPAAPPAQPLEELEPIE